MRRLALTLWIGLLFPVSVLAQSAQDVAPGESVVVPAQPATLEAPELDTIDIDDILLLILRDFERGAEAEAQNESPVEERESNPKSYRPKIVPLFTTIDMENDTLYLINPETDDLIIASMSEVPGWPGGMPMHTIGDPNGRHVWVSSEAEEDAPASLIKFRVRVNWVRQRASLRIVKVLEGEPVANPSAYNLPTQANRAQPIASWTQPTYSQHHGPTYLPFSNFLYYTQWTNDKLRVIDNRQNRFADADPVIVPGKTDHTHGINFNPSGTLGLATGYYYDISEIDVFVPNRENGDLEYKTSIELGDASAHAAFTHYTWCSIIAMR